MLKLLRNKKISKRIFYVLAAVIIPAFVIWGSASVMNKDKAPAFAGRIFGEKISMDRFRETYQSWRIWLRYQYGDKANQAASMINPLQAVWERLIIMHEIKRRNIWVPDKEVVQYVTRLPFLQRNGLFSKQAYDLFLKYTLGVSGRQFEEALRQNLAIFKLSNEINKDTTVTDEEVRQAYEKTNVSTRVRYVSFPFTGYKDAVQVAEKEIQDFYATSKDSLRVPPQINVNYIGMEFNDEKTGLTNEQMQEKMGKALQSARQKGLSLTTQELGFELKETGFFGFEDPIPDFGWLPQLSQILFDLPLLSFSKIIQTSRGLYIFQIIAKKDAYIPGLKEAVPRIKEILTEKKSKEMAREKAQAFLDMINTQGKSFDETAKETGAEAKETEDFTREAYVPELGMAPPLKEAAFGLTEGGVAKQVVELEQGFFVIQSLKTPLFDGEVFAKEKEAYKEKVLDDKRGETFNAFFLSLRERAHVENLVDETSLR